MRLLASNQKRLTHLLVGFLLGGFIPTCYALTCVEMAKLEKYMFGPPPDQKWKKEVQAYENKFRRKVPQWIFTLPLESAAKLLSSCIYLNYRLPPKFLIAGEVLDGFGGLWSSQKTRWDFLPKKPSIPPWIKS